MSNSSSRPLANSSEYGSGSSLLFRARERNSVRSSFLQIWKKLRSDLKGGWKRCRRAPWRPCVNSLSRCVQARPRRPVRESGLGGRSRLSKRNRTESANKTRPSRRNKRDISILEDFRLGQLERKSNGGVLDALLPEVAGLRWLRRQSGTLGRCGSISHHALQATSRLQY